MPKPEPAEADVVSGPRFCVIDKGTPVFVQIAEQLLRSVESGELSLGSKLPSEADLAATFDVSRASVREALCSLQFAGYVESRRGSGSIVVAAKAKQQGPLATSGLRKPADIVDVLEARMVIEPETIRQAALDPVPSAIPRLKGLLAGMELSLEQPQLRAHTDLVIHLALVRSCRNRFMAAASEQLITATDGTLWRAIRDRAWQEGELPHTWLGHHRAIVDAVTGHDGQRAVSAVRAHLLSVLANVVSTTTLVPRDRERVAVLVERERLRSDEGVSASQPQHLKGRDR